MAAGVAHTLSLLLDEAGWGVMWRTGGHTRSPQVAALHGLGPNEQLLGWLYVGGVEDRPSPATSPTRGVARDLGLSSDAGGAAYRNLTDVSRG